jgi:uncharacterized protein (DUF1697 family)
MTTCLAFLRGVNIGPHKKVAMADLKAMLVRMKFADPRTLLNSGNAVFRTGGRDTEDLERALAGELAKRLKLDVDVFVRTAEEWERAIDANPAPKVAKDDPGHFLLLCLKDEPTAAAVKALRAAIRGPETVHAVGRHLYMSYPDGVGTSKVTPALIERILGTRATGRNWNTVLKMRALAADVSAGAPS